MTTSDRRQAIEDLLREAADDPELAELLAFGPDKPDDPRWLRWLEITIAKGKTAGASRIKIDRDGTVEFEFPAEAR